MSGEASFDPSKRDLCDDGNCLGVIVGGKCNVCGAAATAAPRDPGSGGSGGSGDGDGAGVGAPRDPGSGDSGGSPVAALDGGPRDPGSGGGGAAVMAAADHDSFDPGRQLCSDGACTGVLGSDGKCKECGRSAAS